jgi:hypothetical protein
VPWQYVDRAIFTARFCEDATTSVSEPAPSNQETLIYPNPATDRVTITLPPANDDVVVKLMDAQGRTLRSERATATLEWDLSGTARGLYEVVIDRNGISSAQRLVLR